MEFPQRERCALVSTVRNTDTLLINVEVRFVKHGTMVCFNIETIGRQSRKNVRPTIGSNVDDLKVLIQLD
jgi:hypothetical protein